jgi:putative glutamine amidotransferase
LTDSVKPLIGIPTLRTHSHTPPNAPVLGVPPAYTAGVGRSGGVPVHIPQPLDGESLRIVFDRIDGVLLAGGGDVDPACYFEAASDKVNGVDRERDELEITLVRWAVAEGKPLLAICRGIQVMNVALGGNLYQDIKDEVPGALRHDFFQSAGYERDFRAHQVQLSAESRLALLMDGDRLDVNSLHHQAIKDLAPELTLVGHAPDGVVEAVQVDGHSFAVGVQWHPESLFAEDVAARRLFEGLVQAACELWDRRR